MRVWRRGISAAVVVLAAIAGATFPSVPATAVPTVIDVRVAASSDDAEESSGGSVSLTSSDLELVTDGTVVQTVGVRFRSLAIPKGATITAAWIQFETDQKKSVATSLMIRAQAADNAATFVKTSRNVSSRPTTIAGVPWAPPAWNIVQEHGLNQRTPNLSSLVQEVVNRTGWLSGNAIAFLIRGAGVRAAEAYNGTSPPSFHVESWSRRHQTQPRFLRPDPTHRSHCRTRSPSAARSPMTGCRTRRARWRRRGRRSPGPAL